MLKKVKYLAVFDFDGVLYKGHSIFDFIQHQEKENLIPNGTWNDILTLLKLYKKGNKSYTQAANDMLRTYAGSLRGSSYKKTKQSARAFFNDNQDKMYRYFGKLIKKLKKTHDIFIISTNYQFIIEPICELFGLSGYVSSIADVERDIFTGRVKLSLAGNKNIIENLLKIYLIDRSIAVGDSENDIKMLEKVDYPICFLPDSKLENIARKQQWIIANPRNINSILSKYLCDLDNRKSVV